MRPREHVSYPDACLPPRWRILGVPLRPYSLGHQILLRRLRNGFIERPPNGEKPSLADLTLGLWVCSQTFETGAALRTRKPSIAWRLLTWCIKIRSIVRPLNTAARFAWFAQYIRAGRDMPDFFLPPDAAPTGADDDARWKVSFLALGYSHTEVMNLPLAQLFAELLAERERNGQIQVVSPLERAAFNAEPENN